MKIAKLLLIIAVFGCSKQWAGDALQNFKDLSSEEKICVVVAPLILPTFVFAIDYFSDKADFISKTIADQRNNKIKKQKEELENFQQELKKLEIVEIERLENKTILNFFDKVKENENIKNCSYIIYFQEKGVIKIKYEKRTKTLLFEEIEKYRKTKFIDQNLYNLIFDKKGPSISNLLYSEIKNCNLQIKNNIKRSEPVKLDIIKRLIEGYTDTSTTAVAYLWVIRIAVPWFLLKKMKKNSVNIN